MKITVNDVDYEVDPEWQNETLLDVLRDHLGITGTRYSCGIGQCGACLVHVDKIPTNSCLAPVSSVIDKKILTIEGLAPIDGELHLLQKAWIEEAVPQCGFCQSGQIMQALALLRETHDPTDAEIDEAMNSNLCRCGTYPRIRKAIHRAALALKEAE